MVVLIGKCTTCQKTYELTPEQQREAQEMGCAFSPCHSAIATIERVAVRAQRTEQNEHDRRNMVR
jgi:hypothetical protein